MASWTAPVLHATGDVLAVTDWNGLSNDVTFLYQAPYGLYYNATPTTIQPDVSPTPITLSGTTAANYGFSVTGSPTPYQVVLPLTGIYYTTGVFSISVATMRIQTTIVHNGTFVFSVFTTGGAGQGALAGGCVSAAAGDILELGGYIDSNPPTNTISGADQTWLHTFFVGSQ